MELFGGKYHSLCNNHRHNNLCRCRKRRLSVQKSNRGGIFKIKPNRTHSILDFCNLLHCAPYQDLYLPYQNMSVKP